MKTRKGKELKTLAEVLQWSRDTVAGLRGAFGRHRRHLIIDKHKASGTARGPRLGTWWKESRLRQLIQQTAGIGRIPPAIYTEPKPKRQRLNDESFPGAKASRHQRKGSSTPGSTKPSCKTSWLQRWACRHGRSYQDPNYSTTMLALDKKAGRKHSTETQGMGRRGIVRPHIASDFSDWLGGAA